MDPAWRRRLFQLATHAQSLSAVTIGSVLVVHLAAPVVASLGGAPAVDLANRTMLLGREYYQRALLEPVVVWGALAAHLVSSGVRNALLPESDPTDWARPWDWDWETWQRVAGKVLAPVLLLHVLTNRVVPAMDTLPIAGLSPAELDMSYVSFGARASPWATGALYTVLVLAGCVHAAGGVAKLMRRRRMKVRPRYAMAAGVAFGLMLLAGYASIAKFGLDGVSAVLQERMAASYRYMVPYRWLGI